MTRAKPKRRSIVDELAEELAEAQEPDNIEQEQEWSEFAAAIPGGASTVSVYRVGKPGEQDGFLENINAAGMNEQVLRDNYGAGRYTLRFIGANPRRYRGTKRITIAELRPGGLPATLAHGGFDPTVYLREQNDKQFQMILALMGGNKLDIGQMLTGMGAILAAVNGGNKGADLPAVIAAVTQLKTASEPRDQLGMFKQFIELQQAMAPGQTEETWLTVAKDVSKGIIEKFAPTPAPRALAAAAAADPENGDEDEEPDMFQAWLAAQLNFLKLKAKAEKPVEPWIQYVFDNQEEPGNQAVLTALKSGATFENLLQFDEEIQQTPALNAWFKTLYDGLHSKLHTPGNSNWFVRNASDTPSHEATGVPGQPAPGTDGSGGTTRQSGGA